jgi:hypothetical protein
LCSNVSIIVQNDSLGAAAIGLAAQLDRDENLIVVNNKLVFLSDSKIIDANANENIAEARPIIPEFIVSSSSSSSDSEEEEEENGGGKNMKKKNGFIGSRNGN